MKISAKTDIGLVRGSNQDFFLAGELADGVTWAVVCDGMGGAMGGNIASETAARMISEKLSSGYHAGMNDNSVKHLIVSAVEAANASVYAKSRSDEMLEGMGTTVVVTVINDDTMYLAHVGDSRIYVLSKDSINQLTTDHSVVQMMIDNGEITPEEAREHPKKNVITRALGVEDSVRIDYDQEVYNSGETVLLCSDGLTNFVSDEEILNVCRDTDSFSYADRLVEAALRNGGGDNVTVVTITD